MHILMKLHFTIMITKLLYNPILQSIFQQFKLIVLFYMQMN